MNNIVVIGWLCLLSVLTLTRNGCLIHARPSESERVQLWYDNGNTWPPNWQQESDLFKAKQQIRETEIMSIPGADERWENWMQFTQYQMVPKFTAQGFDVIRTPPEVHRKLRDAVMSAIENRWDELRYEGNVGAIYGPEDCKFVDMNALQWEVAEDLRSIHEEWGGMALKATSSYGVRLYLNGSALAMHCDKIHSHVISSIVHIAHEYDDDTEPWPIEIEDHDGKMHSVSLEEGEMLLYESARCLHGRMSALKGRYYGSIFVHYMPVDSRIWSYTNEDVIANVPPHWKDDILEDYGSRWAGAAITVDSLAVHGSPKRYTNVDPDKRDPRSGTPPNRAPVPFSEDGYDEEDL